MLPIKVVIKAQGYFFIDVKQNCQYPFVSKKEILHLCVDWKIDQIISISNARLEPCALGDPGYSDKFFLAWLCFFVAWSYQTNVSRSNWKNFFLYEL